MSAAAGRQPGLRAGGTGAGLVFAGCLVVGLLAAGCRREAEPARAGRVVVLGMDGMEPAIVEQMMASGRLPNFARLAAQGCFSRLGTSMPPQSPVAWSNFISGNTPGVHQIFDFVHRDPRPERPGLAVKPYLSTSRTVPPTTDRALRFGAWRIPLARGHTELLRRGDVFWRPLLEHGVDVTIYRLPATYPPEAVEGTGHLVLLSGMGTPDILGTYGEFTVFTPEAPPSGREVGGGRFVPLEVQDDHAVAVLKGPHNFLREPDAEGRVPDLEVRLDVVRDPTAEVVKVTVGDQVVLLNAGEWSDWLPVRFETGLPGAGVWSALGFPTAIPAIIRLHVKQVHPRLELYVSPLNLDPREPAVPISTPEDFAPELACACGCFYTTGIPEAAKALRTGALSEDEFLRQVELVSRERRRQLDYALDRFERGVLFFYFGETDQVAHMFWRDRDPEHPGRVPEQAERYAGVLEDLYARMDGILGAVLDRLHAEDTVIVMSDHGFTTFRWGFNLNTWLWENGYLVLRKPPRPGRPAGLGDIDWSRTRAYALGLNSLYVNLKGREKYGTVAPGQAREALLAALTEDLLAVRDPRNGRPVVQRVYRVDEVYPGADPELAPDLLVGYARGYRASWSTVLGGIPREVVEDNLDRWSGTHLVAADLVPGILLSNRRLTVPDPTLSDLGPSILALFGIQPPDTMCGRPVLAMD